MAPYWPLGRQGGCAQAASSCTACMPACLEFCTARKHLSLASESQPEAGGGACAWLQCRASSRYSIIPAEQGDVPARTGPTSREVATAHLFMGACCTEGADVLLRAAPLAGRAALCLLGCSTSEEPPAPDSDLPATFQDVSLPHLPALNLHLFRACKNKKILPVGGKGYILRGLEIFTAFQVVRHIEVMKHSSHVRCERYLRPRPVVRQWRRAGSGAWADGQRARQSCARIQLRRNSCPCWRHASCAGWIGKAAA